ncbi:MAG: ACT domain-containing protein [Clostridiales bacterium]|nr:ACT domain-containing protein [Clostridiales bacterium]
MAVTQLSVFLENRPGMLDKTVAAITAAGINIRALSLADTKDFGILRMIVSDIEKTKAAVSGDTVIKETHVIAIGMDDKSGALNNILRILSADGINIEYVYAFTGAVRGKAYVVLRVDDVGHAEKTLSANGIETLSDCDIKEFLE